MKKVKTSKEALKEIKKGNDVWLDEREQDKFELTYGNLKTLEMIPHMMVEPKWRKKLRMLVLEYLTDQTLHSKVRNR